MNEHLTYFTLPRSRPDASDLFTMPHSTDKHYARLIDDIVIYSGDADRDGEVARTVRGARAANAAALNVRAPDRRTESPTRRVSPVRCICADRTERHLHQDIQCSRYRRTINQCSRILLLMAVQLVQMAEIAYHIDMNNAGIT